jgi:hypothetical protein
VRLIPTLLAVLVLPALAACNQVYTRQPLAPEAHEGGDPEFRPGLWKIGDDSDGPFNCPFDIRKPLRDWPDCAVAAEFRRGQMFLLDAHKDADNPFYGWTYAAVTVKRMDQDGHIMQAEMVQADCGPLDHDGPSRNRTNHPFAGLTLVGNNCVAKDLDTVKNALAQSATLGPAIPMRWIRDDP